MHIISLNGYSGARHYASIKSQNRRAVRLRRRAAQRSRQAKQTIAS